MIAQANDARKYICLMQVLQHIELLVQNAFTYNPAHTEIGASILRRAHALLDVTHDWADALPEDLVVECNRIYARRMALANGQKGAEMDKAEMDTRQEPGKKSRRVATLKMDDASSNYVAQNLRDKFHAFCMLELSEQAQRLRSHYVSWRASWMLLSEEELNKMQDAIVEVVHRQPMEEQIILYDQMQSILHRRRASTDRIAVAKELELCILSK